MPDRRLEFALRRPNDAVLQVSSSGLKTWLTAVEGGVQRDIPISHIERFRDGGTVYIETEEGTLVRPTPFGFNKGRQPTWTPTDGAPEVLDVLPTNATPDGERG
jgi:hypothetical protein